MKSKDFVKQLNMHRELLAQLNQFQRLLPEEQGQRFDDLLQQLQTQVTTLISDAEDSNEPAPHQMPPSASKEAEAYLQAMFESIQDYAIFTMDLDNRITTWNTGAERIFGFSEDEALGEYGAIIFTPEDRAQHAHKKEMEQTIRHGRAEDERWHIRKDGSRFFASGVMEQLRNAEGKMRGFIKVARDITARKQGETSEREQRLMSEALREIAIVLSAKLNLDEVLEYILSAVNQVVPHDAAHILLLENGTLIHMRSRGYPPSRRAEFEKLVAQRIRIEQNLPLPGIRQMRETLIIDDLQQNPGSQTSLLLQSARAFISTPIHSENQLLGFLSLVSQQPGVFTNEHGKRLEAFAAQAAVAVQNARLYLQAQELATLNERQRIARDLHDSVSQNLFTASSIIDLVSKQWLTHPERTGESLDFLNRLIRGALAEMRVLLLQLRPTKLLDVRMQVLLQQLVEALQAQKEMGITLAIDPNIILPPDVHITFYRIAQESLNNIAKHARATRAVVRLEMENHQVRLHIQDNGTGFASQQAASGMGLQMMQERASAINARLTIQNRAEGGTEISLTWERLPE